MKLSKSWLLLALPLALVACEAEEEPAEGAPEAVVVDPAAPAPAVAPAAPMDTGMAGMSGTHQMVPMTAVGNSGVTGQATLTPQGQQVQVMVQLSGMQPNSAHSGHIHRGTCQSPGPVVAPLQDITADATGSGSMTTTVSVDHGTLSTGEHIIAYHERAGENHGPTIVCGDIPQHRM